MKSHLELTLKDRLRFIENLRVDCEEALKREKKCQKDLDEVRLKWDRDRISWEESLCNKDSQLEVQLKQMRVKH